MERRPDSGAGDSSGGLRAARRALGYLHSYKGEAFGAFTALVLASAASLPTPQLIRIAIDDGISERGTHAELLERNGLYADLYRRQFREPVPS